MKGRAILLIWYSLIMFVLMALEGLSQAKVILRNGERVKVERIHLHLEDHSYIEVERHQHRYKLDKAYVEHVVFDSLLITYLEDDKACVIRTIGPRNESINCE